MSEAPRGHGRSAATAPRAAFAITALVALAPVSRAAAEERKVTLAEVLDLTAHRHPDLTVAALEEKVALALRREALAHMGPALRVEGSVYVWDKPVELAFGGDGGGFGFDPSTLPPPSTPYEMAFLGLAEGLSGAFGSATIVRNRVTASFSVTIVQPLTPLIAMYAGYKAADLGLTVARLGLEQRRRALLLAATRAYYDALRAAALSEVAAKAVEQLEAHVKRARAYHAAGLIDRSALLAAEVALAGAQGALSSARAGVTAARAALAVAAGLSPAEALVPVEDPAALAPPLPAASLPPGAPAPGPSGGAPASAPLAAEVATPAWTAPPLETLPFDIEEAERRALSSRPELDALAAQVAAAEAGVRAATAALLPTLSAVGSYSHTEGSPLSASDSFFGGAVLSWDAWDWGAKYHARTAAKARADAAAAAIDKVRNLLALEVRIAYLRVQAAAEALRSSLGAVDAADESLRIETARFAANANTSTDVLDAEGRVLKARSDATTARFDYLIALATLRVAMGEAPVGPAAGGAR